MDKMKNIDDEGFCLSPKKVFSGLTGLSEDEIEYIFKRTKELKQQSKSNYEIKSILKKECNQRWPLKTRAEHKRR